MRKVILTAFLLALVAGASARAGEPKGVIVFTSTRDGAEAVYAVRPDGTHLTRLAAGASEARIAPDGRHVAFLTARFQLRILDTSTLQFRPLPGRVGFGWGMTYWPWSPDGAKLAVGSDEGIHIFNADGTGERVITHGSDAGASWSPDGKKVVFSRSGEGLCVVGADGVGERRLVADGDEPQWSPDGSAVAFSRYPATFVVPVDGGAARRMAVGSAEWSPDGKHLAVVGPSSLAVYSPAGVPEHVLVRSLKIEDATWAPDATTLVATVDRDLWLLAADGSTRHRLTHGAELGYVNRQPSWSPGSITAAPPPPLAATVGPLRVVRAADGRPVSFPRISTRGVQQDASAIFAVVGDGSGGFYVGGDFLSAGGVECRNLVHIDARRRVVRDWCPRPDGTVRALDRIGSTLYVGGTDISRIAGASRKNLAAFDIGTGRLMRWNPGSNGDVYAIQADSHNNTVYVSGLFTRLGHTARSNFGAVDGRSGEATAFTPNPDANMHGDSVTAFVATATRVYVWGSYSRIGGRVIRSFGADILDPRTGRYVGQLPIGGGPYSTATLGDRVFLGGVINTLGGRGRDDLASFAGASGAVDAWAPKTGSAIVDSIGLSGRVVVAATSRDHWSGGSHSLVAFDATTGRRVWTVALVNNGFVNVVAASRSLIAVGGGFR